MFSLKALFVAMSCLLLCAGCQSLAEDDYPNDEDAGEDGGSDTDTDADTDTDSDADTDTDADSDVDAGGSTCTDETRLYQVGSGGFLELGAGHQGDMLASYYADAQFYDLSEDYIPDTDNVDVLVAATGVDTCELSYLDGTGSGSGTGLDWLSAGTITLTSGTDSAVLEQVVDGEVIRYGADLLGQGLLPRYGEEYSLVVEGNEAPALELDPAIALPEETLAFAPEPDAVLPRTALAFSWSVDVPGGTAHIEIVAYEGEGGLAEMYRITCEVDDDGEFEVPAEMMEALPVGWYANTSVFRRECRTYPIADDLDFIVIAGTSDTGIHVLGD
jgi:hypothetical protein